MTKIVAETAALADAIAKAARVAPSKGSAFDKAQGVLLEVRPDAASPLYVKSTNLETTYLQRVTIVSAEGQNATWRLPSALAAGIFGTLPMGAGQQVTIEETAGSLVQIEAGKKRAEIRCIEPSGFPLVKPFDPKGMLSVDGMARRIEQAAWCTEEDHPILNGVHMDGKVVVACDRINMAVGECDIPVAEPITVPLRVVAPLLRNVGPIKMRAVERFLQIMPDDDTQITCSLVAGPYPGVLGIRRDEFGGSFKVKTEPLIEAINGMLVLVRGERYPQLHMSIKPDILSLDMQVAETGTMEDEVGISGGSDFEFWITPQNVLNALTHSGSDEVTVSYGPKQQSAIRITDGRGYEFWGMPMKAPTAPASGPVDA